MATRPTRTRSPAAPSEPAAPPTEPAPARRRAPSLRAATARRQPTSSRTLRPVPGESQPAPEPIVDRQVPRQPAAPPPDPIDPEPAVSTAPGSGLPRIVELLQADVRALQGLITERTEQTMQELAKTTLQMVRMVTGIAHHLDQLVEQVQQVTGVAQLLAQSSSRVESTAAVLHQRTQDQLALLVRGQSNLQDALAPILSEVTALRAQRAGDAAMERMEQFRAVVELKQLRQAIEKHGLTPAQASAIPRVSRAAVTKR